MNPRVREAIDRPVSGEELRTALAWTATAERLAYVRRAYARWQRTLASQERS